MLFCRQCLRALSPSLGRMACRGIDVTLATTARAAIMFGALVTVTIECGGLSGRTHSRVSLAPHGVDAGGRDHRGAELMNAALRRTRTTGLALELSGRPVRSQARRSRLILT
jgi:hypothetical protein